MIDPVFDGKRAYQHIEHLAEKIGSRVSGTQGEKGALDYVTRTFESYGLQPQVLSFDVDNDAATAFKLEIITPELGEIPCLPLVGTPDTPPDGLVADLVFVETLEYPYIGPHLEGKIVILVNGGMLGRDLQRLLNYSPLAMILVGKNIGSEPYTFHVIMKDTNKPFKLVPTVHITYEDGVRLWNAGAKRARLVLQTERKKSQSYAVFAEVTGDRYLDEIMVVAGHMDTVPRDNGATDNAAGTATVLELARLYAKRGSKRTLRFACWGSEEGGLVGSMKYVLELKKKDKLERQSAEYIEGYSKTELEKHLLNINLDVLGMSLGDNNCYYVGPKMLGDYVKALTCELGVHHNFSTEIYGSDHISFANVGIPSVGFARGGTGTHYMHTIRDAIDLINVGQLQVIGNLVDVFILRTAAQGHIWPFERSLPDFDADTRKKIHNRIRYAVDFFGEDPELAK
jgi:aminopeptidase YwaD